MNLIDSFRAMNSQIQAKLVRFEKNLSHYIGTLSIIMFISECGSLHDVISINAHDCEVA